MFIPYQHLKSYFRSREVWDESDEEGYDRPDYYTDSSDDLDSELSTAQRSKLSS